MAEVVKASVRRLLASSFSRMMTLGVTKDDCSCSGQYRSIFTTSNIETGDIVIVMRSFNNLIKIICQTLRTTDLTWPGWEGREG